MLQYSALAQMILCAIQQTGPFGVLATLSLLATAMFYDRWLISVWCFFAAVLSSVILLHFQARASKFSVR